MTHRLLRNVIVASAVGSAAVTAIAIFGVDFDGAESYLTSLLIVAGCLLAGVTFAIFAVWGVSRLLGHRERTWFPRGEGLAIAAAGAIIGSILAFPVEVSWDDGCNDHVADAPLGTSWLLKVTTPRDAVLAYTEFATAVDCSPDRPPLTE